MGLNSEAGALRQVDQIFRSKRLVGATVERIDVCPLQPYHVERKPERGPGIARIAPQPGLEARTQITQSERLRRTFHKPQGLNSSFFVSRVSPSLSGFSAVVTVLVTR